MATLDDILEAKARHCLRRARALCKIYAGEMYGDPMEAREAYARCIGPLHNSGTPNG